MTHILTRARLALLTPFGTPLAGDTLFGQLCWALREAGGAAALAEKLDGYTAGRPWLVVSDGFPADFLPRPTLPPGLFQKAEDDSQLSKEEKARKAAQRKAEKKKRWIPAEKAFLDQPLQAIFAAAVDDKIAYAQRQPQSVIQMHNTINRLTGTTGKDGFAPYGQRQTFYAAHQEIDLYLVLDTERTTMEAVKTLLERIGQQGFGRDASVGLGKFSVKSLDAFSFPAHPQANAGWTLGPCAPQGLGFDGAKSYWRVVTRFGRHGNAHALSGQPFKNPLLLAAAGAVFTPARNAFFIGQGLGGNGQLSKTEAATVHQGYAPVLPVFLEPTA